MKNVFLGYIFLVVSAGNMRLLIEMKIYLKASCMFNSFIHRRFIIFRKISDIIFYYVTVSTYIEWWTGNRLWENKRSRNNTPEHAKPIRLKSFLFCTSVVCSGISIPRVLVHMLITYVHMPLFIHMKIMWNTESRCVALLGLQWN